MPDDHVITIKCPTSNCTTELRKTRAMNMIITCECGKSFFMAQIEAVTNKEELIKQLVNMDG